MFDCSVFLSTRVFPRVSLSGWQHLATRSLQVFGVFAVQMLATRLTRIRLNFLLFCFHLWVAFWIALFLWFACTRLQLKSRTFRYCDSESWTLCHHSLSCSKSETASIWTPSSVVSYLEGSGCLVCSGGEHCELTFNIFKFYIRHNWHTIELICIRRWAG